MPLAATFHGRLDLPWARSVLPAAAPAQLVAISESQAGDHPDLDWAIVHNGLTLADAPFERRRSDDLCFVGRVNPEKGIVEAMEIAKLSGRRLRIAAKIGTVPNERDYNENVFQPALKEAGPTVEFLGEVSGEERDALVASSYATLMPGSWPEPFGLVAIESLACGTPVIARRVGGLTEIIREEIDGFFGDDVTQLAFHVPRVAELDREAIRASVIDRFSAKRMADGYEALSGRMLGRDADVDGRIVDMAGRSHAGSRPDGLRGRAGTGGASPSTFHRRDAGHPSPPGRSRLHVRRPRRPPAPRSRDARPDQGAGRAAGMGGRLDLPRPARPPPGDRSRREGRKEYRYHARFRARRESAKYERLVAFARALPAIRRRVDRDLGRPGLPREKVLAAVVRLLELTLIRVGNDEYARLNRSFGLTTLRDRHASVRGSSISFRFRGKSGGPTRWACATDASPRSSGAAATCPARSCSSTWARTASRSTSRATTSTTTSARSLRT